MPLFKKAGRDPQKALIPGVNFVEWCHIIGKNPKEALWLLFPIVNIFTFCGMAVDLVRSFNKLSLADTALAVIYAPLKFFLVGKNDKDQYVGPTLKLEKEYADSIQKATEENNTYELKRLKANNPYAKSSGREWIEAMFFAIFAAAFIRMFLIEAYVIPTSSMEGSLLVGDYLFVSKAHYGIRTPMTVAQIPLLHNTIPILNTESYLESPSLPYFRLPALTPIKRNDPVVFNVPEGDSIILTKERSFNIGSLKRPIEYYKSINELGISNYYNSILNNGTLITRPIDKRDHYIKRCVGVAGDSLQIKDGQIYINGQPNPNSNTMQFSYKVTSSSPLNLNKLDEWGVSIHDHQLQEKGYYNLNLTQVDKIKSLGVDVKVERLYKQAQFPGELYPHDTTYYGNWTADNYGPFFIPNKGATINLTPQNMAMYLRVISAYEQNKVDMKDGKVFINDKESTTYTFKQNYYWMMGDNRHNSEDSRYWGFVPEDHIVGKPLFIWFSTKNGNMKEGIRLNRIFNSAYKM